MPKISQFKVVASLPSTLEPDAVYYVRVGTGFDIYVTNSSGTVVAYPSNQVNPPTVTTEEAQAGTEPGLRSWSPVRIWQAVAAWWAASAMKTKLDGIATGAQVNYPAATQAQAENSSETALLSWAPVRVWQSVIAWWLSYSGEVGRRVAVAATEGAARTSIGCGTAATGTLTTSATDQTTGRVLRVGDHGLGTNTAVTSTGDLNEIRHGSISGPVNQTNQPLAEGILFAGGRSGGARAAQIFVDHGWPSRMFFRGYNSGRPVGQQWGAWGEVWHSLNSSALPASTAIAPATDNNVSAGSSTSRYSSVWAGTATISTSDAREKTPVRPLSDAEISAAIALGNEIGTYQWLYAIEEKGAWARDHAGLTVQRAIEVMQQHGLEPFNYGFICYDQWPDQCVEHPEEYDGDELVSEAWTEVVRTAGDRYSFRGEELLAFIAAGQAAQLRRIEARLSALEKR